MDFEQPPEGFSGLGKGGKFVELRWPLPLGGGNAFDFEDRFSHQSALAGLEAANAAEHQTRAKVKRSNGEAGTVTSSGPGFKVKAGQRRTP